MKIHTLEEIKLHFIEAKTIKWTGSDIHVDWDNIEFRKQSSCRSYLNVYTAHRNMILYHDGKFANIVEKCDSEELKRRQSLLQNNYEIY